MVVRGFRFYGASFRNTCLVGPFYTASVENTFVGSCSGRIFRTGKLRRGLTRIFCAISRGNMVHTLRFREIRRRTGLMQYVGNGIFSIVISLHPRSPAFGG